MSKLKVLALTVVMISLVHTAEARGKWKRWLLEPIIAGAVSGFIAAKVAEQANAEELAAPRHWHNGNIFSAPSSFGAYDHKGRAHRYGPGRYEVEMSGSRDGYDYVLFEDRAAGRLLLVILY